MAKKRGTSKAGKKFIAGMVATAIVAGAGVAGGMAIQNAYADPNAGGDITRLETDLTTEKANHEATKAELAEVISSRARNYFNPRWVTKIRNTPLGVFRIFLFIGDFTNPVLVKGRDFLYKKFFLVKTIKR